MSDPLQTARGLSARFASRAAHWDQTRTYPWDNIAELRAAGLMGMTLPRAHGGQGASLLETVEVVEEIARACTLTARIVVEANMGAIGTIMAHGSAAQRSEAAALVLSGDKPAICISEPEAGSAASHMTTTARRRGDHYVLNGTKHWITGGGVSRLHLIFAQTYDDSGQHQGIRAFVLVCDPAKDDLPDGFEIVRRERTMGLCGMPEATLCFTDLVLPTSALLGGEAASSPGFGDLMTAYNAQRVGAAAIAIGVAAGAMDHAKAYLKTRAQFGRPLAEFQGLQWMLADMDTGVHAARLLIREAAASAAPFPDMALAARAKLFASETAIKVVNDALQMFGARGYSDAEPLERMYRDVRMFTIGGGTAQILRTQLASHLLERKLPQTATATPPLAAE